MIEVHIKTQFDGILIEEFDLFFQGESMQKFLEDLGLEDEFSGSGYYDVFESALYGYLLT